MAVAGRGDAAKLGCGIDVGANTVRLLIAEVRDGRISKPIYSGREITRLGAGIGKTGKLSPKGAAKTLKLFGSFKEAMDRYQVGHIFAAATSAVREADDAAEFVSKANSLGIPLVVISGDEEAKYMRMGVLSGVSEAKKDTLIYDIGGGSVEIVFTGQSKLPFVRSVPVGVVKLAEIYNFRQRASLKTLYDCSAYINHLLKPAFDELSAFLGGRFSGVPIGVAGTVTSVAAVDMEMDIYNPEAVNSHILTEERLERIKVKLSEISAKERLSIKGVERGREDILVPGALIIAEILRLLGCGRSAVSDNGLREGLTIASVA